MLAGAGFPFGTEVVLAREENHSMYSLIYVFITRALRDSILPPKASGGKYSHNICENFFALFTKPSVISHLDFFWWAHAISYSLEAVTPQSRKLMGRV